MMVKGSEKSSYDLFFVIFFVIWSWNVFLVRLGLVVGLVRCVEMWVC